MILNMENDQLPGQFEIYALTSRNELKSGRWA